MVQNTHYVIPKIPDVEWAEIAGYTMIYKTKHLQTYSGGPEGGYVYFYKERLPGWYRWNRSWNREPTCAFIDDGIVAGKWSGDAEYISALFTTMRRMIG